MFVVILFLERPRLKAKVETTLLTSVHTEEKTSLKRFENSATFHAPTKVGTDESDACNDAGCKDDSSCPSLPRAPRAVFGDDTDDDIYCLTFSAPTKATVGLSKNVPNKTVLFDNDYDDDVSCSNSLISEKGPDVTVRVEDDNGNDVDVSCSTSLFSKKGPGVTVRVDNDNDDDDDDVSCSTSLISTKWPDFEISKADILSKGAPPNDDGTDDIKLLRQYHKKRDGVTGIPSESKFARL